MDPLHLTREFMLGQVYRARLDGLGSGGKAIVDDIAVRFLVKDGQEAEAAAMLSRRWMLGVSTKTGGLLLWPMDGETPADLGEVLCWEPPGAFSPIPVPPGCVSGGYVILP